MANEGEFVGNNDLKEVVLVLLVSVVSGPNVSGGDGGKKVKERRFASVRFVGSKEHVRGFVRAGVKMEVEKL